MISMQRLAIFCFLAACATGWAEARTLVVAPASKSEDPKASGNADVFRSLVEAAKEAQPGDEIVLQPGVYYHWTAGLTCRGTQEKPIVIRADKVARGRVVITAADRAIREGKASWREEDAELGLYSISYDDSRRGRPSRVLYSGTDLFPYNSLEHLRTFITRDDIPGPRHGFFYDAEAKTLWVRLHAMGKYGSTDPNDHVIAVSPKGGNCLVIKGDTPAHVVFDGITFETPGQSAIFVDGSHVTLRRCWFEGCIGAVRNGDYVTIEYCDFTHFPAYDDSTEALHVAGITREKIGSHAIIWHRKHRELGCATQDYEDGGLALRMGEGWRIHHNHIHDCFEGLAGSGMSRASNVHIHDNIFSRICDNAIETENHSRDVHIYRNVFVDALDTISYQPLSGPPWPGPIYFHDNVIAFTEEHAALWPYSNRIGASAFKIGISVKNWRDGKHADVPKSPLAAPDPGLFFFRNVVSLPNGKVFNPLGSTKVPIANVFWFDNIFIADHLASMSDAETSFLEGHFEFRNNLSAPAIQGAAGPGPIAAGAGGHTFQTPDAIDYGDARLVQRSFDLPGGLSVSLPLGYKTETSSIGLTNAADWQPPRVGPMAMPEL